MILNPLLKLSKKVYQNKALHTISIKIHIKSKVQNDDMVRVLVYTVRNIVWCLVLANHKSRSHTQKV